MAADEQQEMNRRQRRVLLSIVRSIAAVPLVDRIMLFGSYAKGTQSADSDVDLAVFFNTEKENLLDEYRVMAGICRNAALDVQIQVFHASELQDPCGIIEEIAAYGIELTPESAYFQEGTDMK